MPRKRKTPRRRRELSPDELTWLTGIEQEGSTKLWKYRQGYPGDIPRLRQMIAENKDLIPPGRMEELGRDLQHWSGPKPRVIDSFR